MLRKSIPKMAPSGHGRKSVNSSLSRERGYLKSFGRKELRRTTFFIFKTLACLDRKKRCSRLSGFGGKPVVSRRRWLYSVTRLRYIWKAWPKYLGTVLAILKTSILGPKLFWLPLGQFLQKMLVSIISSGHSVVDGILDQRTLLSVKFTYAVDVGRYDGLVVSVPAFHADDPSSNPTEVCKLKNHELKGREWPILEKT